MVGDEMLDIAQDLRIALMRVGRDGDERLAVFLIDGRGLRVQHKGDGQKALAARSAAVARRDRTQPNTLIHSIWTGQQSLIILEGRLPY
jgi:hypothetical protein